MYLPLLISLEAGPPLQGKFMMGSFRVRKLLDFFVITIN